MTRPRRALLPDPAPEGFNMTPMIDVVFQLLIFFMLATHFAQTDPLRLPAASKADIAKTLPNLVVNVTADGKVRVDGRILSDEALERLLSDPRRVGREGVTIRADRSAPFERVQLILTVAADHGRARSVQFAALKE